MVESQGAQRRFNTVDEWNDDLKPELRRDQLEEKEERVPENDDDMCDSRGVGDKS